MNIPEAVKIIVTMNNNKKVSKIVTIIEDGSYGRVDLAVSKIVGEEIPTAVAFFWQYV